jgi:hypothetical protein
MMDKKTPKKGGKGRFWWWPFLLGIAAAFFGFFWMTNQDPIKKAAQEEIAHQQEADRPLVLSSSPPEEEVSVDPDDQDHMMEENLPHDPCASSEELKDFFRYLEQRNYVRHLLPDEDVHTCFKEVLEQLAAHPPVPAGEGVSAKLIAENIYHLFRVLKGRDLRLIREVLHHEQETMEIHLDTLYRWLMAGNSCPDGNLKPPREVLYDYAGFLMTSIGGRAYLFRRATEIRLLLTYYSILILHEADLKGKNRYGIDVYPLVSPLLNEIHHYPDLHYQEKYVQELNRIVIEYRESRGKQN